MDVPGRKRVLSGFKQIWFYSSDVSSMENHFKKEEEKKPLSCLLQTGHHLSTKEKLPVS